MILLLGLATNLTIGFPRYKRKLVKVVPIESGQLMPFFLWGVTFNISQIGYSKMVIFSLLKLNGLCIMPFCSGYKLLHLMIHFAWGSLCYPEKIFNFF